MRPEDVLRLRLEAAIAMIDKEIIIRYQPLVPLIAYLNTRLPPPSLDTLADHYASQAWSVHVERRITRNSGDGFVTGLQCYFVIGDVHTSVLTGWLSQKHPLRSSPSSVTEIEYSTTSSGR